MSVRVNFAKKDLQIVNYDKHAHNYIDFLCKCPNVLQ